jgi:hypothetical protein
MARSVESGPNEDSVRLLQRESLLLARNGHAAVVVECPLFGVKLKFGS